MTEMSSCHREEMKTLLSGPLEKKHATTGCKKHLSVSNNVTNQPPEQEHKIRWPFSENWLEWAFCFINILVCMYTKFLFMRYKRCLEKYLPKNKMCPTSMPNKTSLWFRNLVKCTEILSPWWRKPNLNKKTNFSNELTSAIYGIWYDVSLEAMLTQSMWQCSNTTWEKFQVQHS